MGRLLKMILGGALLLGAPPLWAQTATDAATVKAAHERLALALGPSARTLTVQSEDGHVTVTGRVESLLEERRVLQLLRMMRGVRSVHDTILVEPDITVTDQELQAALRPVLEPLPAGAVDLHVDQGHVTLDGTVPDWSARVQVQDAVEGMRGVRSVRNQLVVEPAPDVAGLPSADAAILSRILRAVQMDRRVADAVVQVQVQQGVVTLQATVGSAQEATILAELAQQPGVTFIDDTRVTVDPQLREARAASAAEAADRDVEAAVLAALARQPALKGMLLTAEVGSGQVTLAGSVRTLDALETAESATRTILGVQAVHNQLRVEPSVARGDRALEREARRRLRQSPLLHGARRTVGVTVRQGGALLSGRVRSQLEFHHAEDLLQRLEGLVALENRLRVEGLPRPDDTALRQQVQRELFWSPWVDSDEVQVQVKGGVATLRGEVDTVMERVAAEANAREAGAEEVVNRLTVAGEQGG